MPFFRVSGVYRKSGKPISLPIRAKTEKTAANKASRENGITVQSVDQIHILHFTCHVAGTSHSNRDGSDRQVILKRCNPPEKVWLEHETNNRHDKHAIRIVRTDRTQIGYVPQYDAVNIIDGFDQPNGCKIAAVLLSIAPFDDDTDLLTGELLIAVASNAANESEIRDYLASEQLPIAFRSALPFTPLPHVEIETGNTTRSRTTTATRRQQKTTNQKSGCLLLVTIMGGIVPIGLIRLLFGH